MGAQKYVLLVDDEEDFLETTSYWLKAKGYTVKTAHNGKEALQMISDEEPYIVFLDINMPEMNGIQILEQIRRTRRHLPVIMVTAAYNDERMERARELGISGFFPKQSSLESLVNILETSIRMIKRESEKS